MYLTALSDVRSDSVAVDNEYSVVIVALAADISIFTHDSRCSIYRQTCQII